MKASISTVIASNDNYIFDISNESTLEAPARRHSKTATLDGNSSIVDMGYSSSDSNIKIIAYDADKDIHQSIIELVKNGASLMLSVDTGVYIGIISPVSSINEPLKFTFRIRRSA